LVIDAGAAPAAAAASHAAVPASAPATAAMPREGRDRGHGERTADVAGPADAAERCELAMAIDRGI
jgi:hypothetical protein